jgi:hypothetical protein
MVSSLLLLVAAAMAVPAPVATLSATSSSFGSVAGASTRDGDAVMLQNSAFSKPITGTATKTFDTIALATNYNTSAVSSGVYAITGTPIIPYIQVNGAAWQEIASATVSPGAVVNLGPQPLTGGYWLWIGPKGYFSTSRQINSIPLSTGANIFVATYLNSSGGLSTLTFTITVVLPTAATPTFSPAPGTYSSSQTVTLSDATAGEKIYYTTNGTTPTTISTLYSKAITVSATTTIKAIAVATNYGNSSVASGVYGISTPIIPYIQVNGAAWQEIASATVSPGAVVNLGPQPLTGGSWSWAGPSGYTSTSRQINSIPLSAGANVFVATYTNSSGAASTEPFTITLVLPTAATPTFSPAPGSYSSSQTVTLSDATTGAKIYYTTNNTPPTANSTLYSKSIAVSATTTIEAIAVAANYNNSAMASGVYTLAKSLTSITLTGTRGSTTAIAPPTLAAGTTLQVYATGVYTDGSTADITAQATWSSTTGTTAVGGLITAVSTGDPTVSASLSGITGSTGVTVTAPALQSIAITPAGTTTVAAGRTQQFTATGTFTNKTTQNITSSVTWSSSETSVVMSTTTPGLATTTDAAINTSATISASMTNSLGSLVSAATPATLTVSPAALVSIAVTPIGASITSGTTEAFSATGTYSDGTTQTLTSSVAWSATTLSGGGAATFTGNSSANVAKATAAGDVTITATSGSISGSTPLIVTAPALVSIVVTSTAPAVPPTAGIPAVVTIYQGQTQQFYALGTFSDSSIQNITETVAWSAGTGSVATVGTSGATAGLATAVAAGTVPIVATSGSITGSGTLTVIGLTSVTITPASPTVGMGDANTADPPSETTNNTLQFTATATYADGTTPNVTASATWTATGSTPSTPTVATIAGATGLATLQAAGTITITATYAGVSGNTLLTVTPAVLESIAVCLGPYPGTSCSTSTTPVGANLGLNGTQQFSAVGNYSDGSTQNLTDSATWASNDTQVVTVSSTGLATALAATNVAVAVTAGYGSFAPNQNIDTAFVSALSTLPISCPSPTIDLNILVVNNAEANSNAGYADFPAIQQILNYVGTPYTVVDVSAAPPTLSDGACHGYFQGVIFAYGGDYYSIPSWQSTLISYEQTFNVRQVNWYDTPDPNFGLSYTGTQIPDTSTYTTNFTAAAAPVFYYANTTTPLTITNASVDLATADVAAGGSLTPLLQDTSGNIVSGIYNLNGQQFLSQTFDSNPYLTHDLVVAYGLLNWVTKGVFLGDYHVYATQEIDDFFINDSEWIPSTTCLTNLATKDRTLPDASNLPVFRVDASDMAQLVAWQTTKQKDPLLSPGTTFETTAASGKFELTIAMNGVGTSGNGDWTGLTAPIVSSSSSGGVATFTAQDFSGQVGQQVTTTNTVNGGGVLNGTWTITSVTKSAVTTPGTATFTATAVSPTATPGTLALRSENGADDITTTATASVADDLVGNLQNYQQYFHWISHTYDHPTTLNGLCQSSPTGTGCGDIYNSPATDNINLEVLTNLWTASAPGGVNLDTDSGATTGGGPYSDAALSQLTFTDFAPGNIVTPGVTGLNDPNVPGYLYAAGIRYAVSDTSVATTTDPPNNNGPNPTPNVGIVNSYEPGIYEVPRHPNDVFYNVANWADDDAEFVCIYSNYVAPTAPAGTQPAPDPPFNTYNAAQVLDFTSTAFVNNMLIGDMDPEMFHQPDLHFSDNYANLTNPAPSGTIPASVTSFLGTATTHVSSLLSDTYDLTFSKYEALYKLPVLTPTLDQMGVLMQNRNSFNLSGVTASIVAAGTANATLSITMPSTATVPAAVIPVTGLTSTGSELYGGQTISHIDMSSGQTINFPLP